MIAASSSAYGGLGLVFILVIIGLYLDTCESAPAFRREVNRRQRIEAR